MVKHLVSICCQLGLAFVVVQVVDADEPIPVFITPPMLAESQLWDINANNDAVGRCEIYDSAGTSVADFGCVYSKGNLLAVPKLAPFRRMECVAMSNTGLVVGHAYSPNPLSTVTLQAIAFDVSSNRVEPLPALNSQGATIATAVSANGERIAGVCQGKACVWSRLEGVWHSQGLPLTEPDQVTRHVVLSDDGKTASASVRNARQVQLMTWHCDDRATWQTAERQNVDVAPQDVNNEGVVVGSKLILGQGTTETRGFVLLPNQSIQLILPLTGDNFTTARSINNQNVVVGWSDAVGDSEKGPHGYFWQGGQMSVLPFNELSVGGHQAFAINDEGVVVGLAERHGDRHCVGFQMPLGDLLNATTQRRGE